MKNISELKIKICADGADINSMLEWQKNPAIKGFTTNPTLMYKAGIKNYEIFAKEILDVIKDKPVSFEVLSDDFSEMQRQALKIASWGKNVYVKIPIVNTAGKSSVDLIKTLAHEGVKQNVTAVMTLEQVRAATEALQESPAAIISVFAGRIADTGRDPVPVMRKAFNIMHPYPQLELLWASSRELFNIFQANEAGCHIITVAHDLLKKLDLVGKDLQKLTLETVKTFYDDAMKAGLSLP
ncbi:MAG TPA: transaldolase [Gammaproteobacteria bacterium]|nr:transaldolase [Gammaproteobacteria bacterium]